MIPIAFLVTWAAAVKAVDSATLNRMRGTAARAYANGFYEAAEKHYRTYLEAAQQHSEARLMESGIGLVKSLFAQYRFDEALAELNELPEHYAKLRQLNSRLPPKLHQENELWIAFWHGRILLAQDEAEKALPHLVKAVKTPVPDRRLKAIEYLARCYLAKEDWDRAEAEFRRLQTMSQKEDHRNAGRLGLLELMIQRRQWSQAEARFKAWWASLKDSPGEWRTRLAMLRVLMLTLQDKPIQALNFYNGLFANRFDHLKDQAHFLILRMLGDALAAKGELPQARRLLGTVLSELAFDQQRREVILTMGEQAMTAGKVYLTRQAEDQAVKWFALADEDFSRFLASYQNHPMTPKVLYRRGQLRRLRGQMFLQKAENDKAKLETANRQFTAAIEDFMAAINHKQAAAETKYEAMLQLAMHYRQEAREYRDALEWLATAAKQEVDREKQARALFLRGVILESDVGLYDDAAHQFKIVANQYGEVNPQIKLTARFRQADATYKFANFKDAAVVFGQFLDEAPPNSSLRPQAMYLKGVSHRLVDQTDQAINILRRLADEHPAAPDELAAKALLQAAEAAIAADIGNDALTLLSRVLKEFGESSQAPIALYRRIYVNLQFNGDEKAALDDMNTFFDTGDRDYAASHPELAADILLWFGDHFAAKKEYKKAQNFMLRAVKEFPRAKVSPMAQYEAAKCAYYLRRMTDAVDMLNSLFETYGEVADDRVLAQANYLYGDILAEQDKYEEAQARFQRCAGLVKGRLHYAALGRIGEMRFSMAGQAESDDKYYADALDFFDRIIADGPQDFRRKALYRRAKVKKKLRDPSAITDLSTIFNSYEDQVIRLQHWDWFYFVRAGIELAAHYERTDELAKAIRVYDRLAAANISFAPEARQRAEELRKRQKVSPILFEEEPADTPAEEPAEKPAEPADPAPAPAENE